MVEFIINLFIIIGAIRVLLAMKEVHKDLNKPTETSTKNDYDTIYLSLELHQGLLYAFNDLTGAFVCQATDIDGIKKEFMDRFPKKNGVVVKADELATAHLRSAGFLPNES